MARVKVISEAGDLVPLLRALDSEIKRQVFHDLIDDWHSTSAIEETYGEEGLEALGLLEKAHLVETQWAPGDDGPQKSYRSFYSSFHLDVSSPVDEIVDLLHVAVMDPERFRELEHELTQLVGDDGVSTRLAQEKLGLTTSVLRGLVKRSAQLDIKGHQIVERE